MDEEILLLVQNLMSICIILCLICINLYLLQFKRIEIDISFILILPIVIINSFEYISLNFSSILLILLLFVSISINAISIFNLKNDLK